MNMLVLGGGKMGLAIAHDLVKNGAEVQIGDVDKGCIKNMPRLLDKVEFVHIDASNAHQVEDAMKKKDAVISALPYDFNYSMAKTAVKCKANFCDLGGNIEIVERELSLHEKAMEAGVTIIPDCGLAPGTTNILAAHLIKKADAREMHIRVGGIPLNPEPPLNYALVFSVHGLINEYVEKAKIIRKGKLAEVESLTGLEDISFPEFGRLEAFYTSGGTSTLSQTFLGKLDELDYKTIRYAGHCDKIRFLRDMGFFDGKARSFTEKTLERALNKKTEDVVLARLTALGKDTVSMDMIDYCDGEGISAMMRTTGFPTSIIAQMIVNGDTGEGGALPPEKCVPPGKFMHELQKRNIMLREKKR